MKKKIILSIVVLVILSVIGFGMYFYEQYNKSDKGLSKKYFYEVEDKYELTGDSVLIKMLKTDLNNDQIEDYIGLVGIPKYTDNKNKLDQVMSTLESYSNVELVVIHGENKEIITYKSEETFFPEVRLEVKGDSTGKYIFVDDDNSGNIILSKMKNNELKNIIKDSIQSDLNGYTINVNFDEENPSKIKIKLDNYARSYLNAAEDGFALEFDNKNINKENYRATYLANKFCTFKLEDANSDGLLDLIGVQNILYLNNSDKKTTKNYDKTAGSVNTIFRIEEDKIKYDKVEVKK